MIPRALIAALLLAAPIAGCLEENSTASALEQQNSPPTDEPAPGEPPSTGQQADLSVPVGSPDLCYALPIWLSPTYLLDRPGVTYDRVEFDEGSGGLAYAITFGSTGQELAQYWYFIADEERGGLIGRGEPGSTVAGILEDNAATIFVAHCAGGAGKAHLETYASATGA